MTSSGWPVLGAAFLLVLVLIGGAYAVIQTYVPPVSATAPVTPEVRQFGVFMHTFEVADGTVRHWMPSTIIVNAGDSVILRITNSDQEESHGFSLGALNVVVPSIKPGQTVIVRFKALRPGIYHYGCTLAGCSADHADQTGQFVVLSGR